MSHTPPFAAMVDRIGAQEDGAGPEAWDIHVRAVTAQSAGQRVAGKPVIVMSVGDPDLETPPAVKAAAIAAIEGNDTHYTPILGRDALRSAIAKRFAQQSGLATGPENVFVASGTQGAMFSAMLCLTEAGTDVIAFEPMYLSYTATIRASGAGLVHAAMPSAGGFRPTKAALEAAITPRSRAILYASPNNPTGVMITRAEAEAIAEVAIEHDLWVVADEVYAATGFDRAHVSIAALPGMAERTVTIGSLSKSHAMTGWRIGWAIGPTALTQHFENLALCMLYGLPGFAQAGALAALTDEAEGGAWPAAAEMCEIYRRRRDVFVRAINQIPGLRCDPPEGGMFGLVDVRGTGLSAAAFAEGLYEAEGVAVLPADPFGASAAGFVRVSFAIAEAELAEACERIAGFVRGL